ncbi:hypothetical protein Tco_0637843 [Tanacetum coccineum]
MLRSSTRMRKKMGGSVSASPILLHSQNLQTQKKYFNITNSTSLSASSTLQYFLTKILEARLLSVERDVAFSDVAGQEVTDIGFAAACPLGIGPLSLSHAEKRITLIVRFQNIAAEPYANGQPIDLPDRV